MSVAADTLSVGQLRESVVSVIKAYNDDGKLEKLTKKKVRRHVEKALSLERKSLEGRKDEIAKLIIEAMGPFNGEDESSQKENGTPKPAEKKRSKKEETSNKTRKAKKKRSPKPKPPVESEEEGEEEEEEGEEDKGSDEDFDIEMEEEESHKKSKKRKTHKKKTSPKAKRQKVEAKPTSKADIRREQQLKKLRGLAKAAGISTFVRGHGDASTAEKISYFETQLKKRDLPVSLREITKSLIEETQKKTEWSRELNSIDATNIIEGGRPSRKRRQISYADPGTSDESESDGNKSDSSASGKESVSSPKTKKKQPQHTEDSDESEYEFHDQESNSD